MNEELIRAKASEARTLSNQAIEKFNQGKYVEGHTLMTLAREAARTSASLIKQKTKLNTVLSKFEEIHQS
jgi:hypothetical protein